MLGPQVYTSTVYQNAIFSILKSPGAQKEGLFFHEVKIISFVCQGGGGGQELTQGLRIDTQKPYHRVTSQPSLLVC